MPIRHSILCILLLTTAASAQDEIHVDWSSKELVSYPPQVDRTTSVKIVIHNVNDFLYTYTQQLQGTPRTTSDSELVFNLAAKQTTGPGAPAPPACTVPQSKIDGLQQAFQTDYRLNPDIDKTGSNSQKPQSVPLSDSSAAYNQKILPSLPDVDTFLTELAQGACQALLKEYQGFEKRLNRMRDAAAKETHDAIGQDYLRPDTDYKLTIIEFWNGIETESGTKQFTFSPGSNNLTLSVGVGLTTIQSRSYTPTSVPNGTTTRNILVVGDGGSPRPIGLGLLNYNLFDLPGRFSNFSFALSSGPVIQGSGKSSLQPLGYFAAVSLSLFHRFFISPGFHVAEFADFPAGFGPNQAVPTGFGTPTPVKRWTARFAVGLTYKATSLGSSSKVTPTDTTTKKSSTATSANKKPKSK
jgi:hypothetical protein